MKVKVTKKEYIRSLEKEDAIESFSSSMLPDFIELEAEPVEPTPTEEKCVGFSLDKNVKVCACPCHSKAPKEQMVPKKLGILPLDGSAVYVLENKVNDIIDYLS